MNSQWTERANTTTTTTAITNRTHTQKSNNIPQQHNMLKRDKWIAVVVDSVETLIEIYSFRRKGRKEVSFFSSDFSLMIIMMEKVKVESILRSNMSIFFYWLYEVCEEINEKLCSLPIMICEHWTIFRCCCCCWWCFLCTKTLLESFFSIKWMK